MAITVGVVLITTEVVVEAVHPLFIVTVYVPAITDVAFVIKGDCTLDVNPFGPLQE